jgi:hypothetical protein
MKTKVISGLSVVTILICWAYFDAIFTSVFDNEYFSYDVADDEYVFYNPLKATPTDFHIFRNLMFSHENSNEKDSITYYSEKLIAYRNSYNEIQQEKLYSCANGYWDDKNEKLLTYSTAYMHLGNLDSAKSVLAEGLMVREGYRSTMVENGFFVLLQLDESREHIESDIEEAMKHSRKLDCQYCCDSAYTYQDYEIGYSVSPDVSYQTFLDSYFEQIFGWDLILF